MKTKYTRIFSNPIRIKVAGLLMMLAVPFANAAYGDDQDAQLRGGLAHCRAKFLRERTGLVVYLGGSITNSPGWTQQVSADLTKRFPETKFTFVNAGIPSIDSTGHAFRFTRDVLQKGLPDLIIVEAAVNDLHNGRTAIESIRGLEGIVRQARRAQRNVDILGLHFADPAHLADYAAGRTPAVIASHEKVLAHYSIPSINFARDVQRQIAAGQLDWARDFKDVHPSPFGHDYYYRGIASLFDRAWPDPEKAAAPPKAPVEHASVAALDAHSYDAGTLVTPTRATDLQGFRMESNWKPTDKAGTRDGFVNVDMLAGTKPGDQFRFAFEGRAIGFFMTTGPDAGTIEYRIDGGEWKQRDTRTQWSNALHLPWLLVLESELESAPHQIEVRLVEPRVNPNHSALRLRDIAVNGP
ncbi:MAG: hypothetical protein RIS70_2116, partial [Planctomycetota bacterium]